MVKLSGWLSKYKEWGPTFLRIAFGLIFIYHGYGKLWGTPGMEAFTGMIVGMGFPGFMAYVVALIEFFGGLLVLLGLFTRYAAFLNGVVMVFAIFLVHLSQGFGKYEFPLSLMLTAIALMLLGPGKLSFEQAVFKKEW